MGLRPRTAVGGSREAYRQRQMYPLNRTSESFFGDGHAQADRTHRAGPHAERNEAVLRSRNSPTRSSFAASPHLIDRSLAPDHGGDPIRVVPLCRRHHTDYDEGVLDLLPYLVKMAWRHELAHAVLIHPGGIVGALERVTNTAWGPA
jgi:hypothetical protein